MAVHADVVWYGRTDGHDDNGGGFQVGIASAGTDRSQQTAPHATLTTAATVHTTTTQINVPSGEHTVHANDIGNVWFNKGGTSTSARRVITAVDVPNNRWTLDASVGTAAQTCAGRMGGSVINLSQIGGNATTGGVAAGQKFFMKAGTYTKTATTTLVVGGYFQENTQRPFRVIGYATTPGDRPAYGSQPVIDVPAATGSNLHGIDFTPGTNGYWIENVTVDMNGNTNSHGIRASGSAIWGFQINCHVLAATAYGFFGGGEGLYMDCTARDCTSAATAGFRVVGDTQVIRCWALNNACAGFYSSSKSQMYLECLATGNTGSSGHGFWLDAIGFQLYGCVSHGNAGDGLRSIGAYIAYMLIQRCIFTSNGGYGVRWYSSNTFPTLPIFDFNAFYNNTSGPYLGFNSTAGSNGVGVHVNSNITLTADPFVNAAGGDFRLNAAPGGGALCREIGITATVTGLTSYGDLGAYHARRPAGSTFQLGI